MCNVYINYNAVIPRDRNQTTAMIYTIFFLRKRSSLTLYYIITGWSELVFDMIIFLSTN